MNKTVTNPRALGQDYDLAEFEAEMKRVEAQWEKYNQTTDDPKFSAYRELCALMGEDFVTPSSG